MSKPRIQAVHSIPAFAVGGLVWTVLSIFLSRFSDSVLTFPSWGNLYAAAFVFFPLFFLLRWLKILNIFTLAGGIVLATLAFSLLGDNASATPILLRTVMAAISGCVAFVVLRGGARADASGKV